MKLFLVTSLSHGRLEIPGKKEPLFFGGTHTYSGELPDKVKYFLGTDMVSIKETSSVAPMVYRSQEEEKPDKGSGKKSEKNSKES